MLPLCKAEGIGVIPWSPLARGRVTHDFDETTARTQTDEYGKTLYTANVEADRQVAARVAEIAAARGLTRAQIALAWLLQKSEVTAPIVGATQDAAFGGCGGSTLRHAQRQRDRRARRALCSASRRRLQLSVVLEKRETRACPCSSSRHMLSLFPPAREFGKLRRRLPHDGALAEADLGAIPVEREPIPFVNLGLADLRDMIGFVDGETLAADETDFAELARHDRRMRGAAADGGQYAGCDREACHILGRCLAAE